MCTMIWIPMVLLIILFAISFLWNIAQRTHIDTLENLIKAHAFAEKHYEGQADLYRQDYHKALRKNEEVTENELSR